MTTKHCKQCGEHKPLTEFYFRGGLPRERCKACVIQRSLARYYANPEREKARVVAARQADPRVRMASDIRRRDRARGLECDIEAEQIVIPATCPVLGIPMVTQVGQAVSGSPSIDHIDPTRGAVWGNWTVISRKANGLKRQHTAASLEAFIAAVESGRHKLRGRATLEEYRAVLRYVENPHA